ncbi:translational GTPase TypA [Tepidiforma sp.]|jgi:GTP-binding protein|uniref:translational GTPase TypA n=1 Tax=Tepidiforma sp. TaxID=2682230 RepID=UPI00261CF361|nr:translational GTPase TypA [Tepidiforma sp.]MCX7617373.1 translational GTPase TypA [Tepidiforma sp.]
MPERRADIRNVAIIAHVDHGKTTLVDALLKQSRVFRENEQVGELILDSNPLEREKGITIMAKNAAIEHAGVRINIIDTPGHADFGGEVERVLNMADGCLLVVDAAEGPMPQTRFVLRKALELGLHPVVVINKIDRPNARPAEVLDLTSDLFLELATHDYQLEFPVIYASARDGYAGTSPDVRSGDMGPLFRAILDHIPPPECDASAPFRMLVTTLLYDSYRGRIAVGRIRDGAVRPGMAIQRFAHDGAVSNFRVGQVFGFRGLDRVELESAEAGDIVAVTGVQDVLIGETLAAPEVTEPLPAIALEPPAVKMTFRVNDSPFAGREGQFVTSRQLRERLFREVETNIALRVEEGDSPDQFIVSGRGELHLAILVETMRREGFEFAVTRPEVILRDGPAGREEPFERLYIEAPESATGFLIEALSGRKAQMVGMHSGEDGRVRFEFDIPTRGLIGFRDTFVTGTAGEGIMNTEYLGYRPWAGDISRHRSGALVASETGTALAYGIAAAQERGILFISPGDEVYVGMVVGLHSRDNDLDVNVCRAKHLTNIRSSTSDIAVKLVPPQPPSLEQALTLIAPDEMVEVTPKAIRIRKAELNPALRAKEARKAKYAALEAGRSG